MAKRRKVKEVQVVYPPEHTIVQRFYDNHETPDDVLLRMKALEFSCRTNKLSLGSDGTAHDLVSEAEDFYRYMKDGTVPAAPADAEAAVPS